MKKHFKILLLLILITPLLGSSQQKNYRIITKKSGTFYAAEVRDLGESIDILELNGNSKTLKSKDVLDIREEIEGWNYFQWTENEFTDFIVVKVDSLSQKELFNLTLNWIKETYTNPDEVIKTTIDSSKVRIEGFQDRALKYASLSTVELGAKYTIEISFKKGRYKFNPINLSYELDHPIGEVSVPVSSTKSFYNEKGKLHGFYKYMPPSVEALFNNLNISLYNYIVGTKTKSLKKDDW